MSRVCLKCAMVLEGEKQYCGQCGQRLPAVEEAVVELKARLVSAPADEEALNLLEAVLDPEDPGARADVIELWLAWCEAKLAQAEPGRGREAIRERLHALAEEELQPEAIDRLAACLLSVNAPEEDVKALLEDAELVTRLVADEDATKARSLWSEACVALGRTLEGRKDRWQALRCHRIALAVNPLDSAARASVDRLEGETRRGRKVLITASLAVIAIVAFAAWLFWFLSSAWLEVRVPAGATVASSDRNGVSRQWSPGADGRYRTKFPAGEVRLAIAIPGHFDWDTTLLLAGGHTIRIQPSLRSGEAAWRFESIPSASVSLDGARFRETPLDVPQLPMGSHRVQFTAPFCRSYNGTFDVQPGRSMVIRASLVGLATGHWAPEREFWFREGELWDLRQDGPVISGHVQPANDDRTTRWKWVTGSMDANHAVRLRATSTEWGLTNSVFFEGTAHQDGSAIVGSVVRGEGVSGSGAPAGMAWSIRLLNSARVASHVGLMERGAVPSAIAIAADSAAITEPAHTTPGQPPAAPGHGGPSSAGGLGNPIGSPAVMVSGSAPGPSTAFALAFEIYVTGRGWSGWSVDGTALEASNQNETVEALRIRLVHPPPGTGITYQGHVSDIGWMDWVTAGEIIGVPGESHRLEAVRIKLLNAPPGLRCEYRVNPRDLGWTRFVSDGEDAGTTGQSRPLDGVQVRIIR